MAEESMEDTLRKEGLSEKKVQSVLKAQDELIPHANQFLQKADACMRNLGGVNAALYETTAKISALTNAYMTELQRDHAFSPAPATVLHKLEKMALQPQQTQERALGGVGRTGAKQLANATFWRGKYLWDTAGIYPRIPDSEPRISYSATEIGIPDRAGGTPYVMAAISQHAEMLYNPLHAYYSTPDRWDKLETLEGSGGSIDDLTAWLPQDLTKRQHIIKPHGYDWDDNVVYGFSGIVVTRYMTEPDRYEGHLTDEQLNQRFEKLQDFANFRANPWEAWAAQQTTRTDAFHQSVSQRWASNGWKEAVRMGYRGHGSGKISEFKPDLYEWVDESPNPQRASADAVVGSPAYLGSLADWIPQLLSYINTSDIAGDKWLKEKNPAPVLNEYLRLLKRFQGEMACMVEAANAYWAHQEKYQKTVRQAFGEGKGVKAAWKRFMNLMTTMSRHNAAMVDLIKASTNPAAMAGKDRQQTIFNEQCFLLSYVSKMSDYKKRRDKGAGIMTGSIPTDPNSTISPAKAVPYYNGSANSSLLLDGDPYGFLNVLTQNEHQKVFFNMESQVLNHLQPMIRLYKIEYNRNNKPTETEFKFDSNQKLLENVLNSKLKRGYGAGIKSFDFAYEGSNPFSVKKSIKATLKIFANSMSELFENRGSSTKPWSYIDLALKTRQSQQSDTKCKVGGPIQKSTALKQQNLDKLNFRLKAVVGWARPNGEGPWSRYSYLTDDENRNRQFLMDGISNSYTTLNLTPTVHHFEFDELGRVILSIDYFAFIEDYFDSPVFNIFAGTGTTLTQIVRTAQLNHYSQACKPEDLKTIKESLAENAADEKATALTSLIKNLKAKKRIYYIKLPYRQIAHFNSKGPFYNFEADQGVGFSIKSDSQNSTDVVNSMETAFSTYTFGDNSSGGVTEDDRKVFRSSLMADNPQLINLSFFYVSDLIDSVLEALEVELKTLPAQLENELDQTADITACEKTLQKDKYARAYQNFKQLRILLGPVEFVNQGANNNASLGGPSLFVNFGDMPISVKYFIEYLAAQMLKKDRSTYNLTTFLNDLFNKLVREFLNEESCFDWNIKQKVRVNQSTLTSYPKSRSYDNVSRSMIRKSNARINLSQLSKPILNISGPEGPAPSGNVAREMNYFVYFAGRTAPAELMKGKKRQDERKGIFHYTLGRDRGLIKNIQLSKTDSRGLAEVRFEQDGYDGLKQLRVVYDVTINSYAEVKAFPGTYIYVDPRGFDPSSTTREGDMMNITEYGIGGYFMIVKSEHSFGPGKAETTIYAKWVNAVADTYEQQGADPNDTTAPATLSRCSTSLAARRTNAEGQNQEMPEI